MKDVVLMLIAQNQTLLAYHQAIMQQYKDTMEGLIKIADAYPESSRQQQDRPDFLPKDQEKALVRRLLAEETEADMPAKLPRHISVTFITEYLNISPSTFYRQINGKQLSSVCRIGNKLYYLLVDLLKLMQKGEIVLHEKGAWTFAKFNKSRKESGNSSP